MARVCPIGKGESSSVIMADGKRSLSKELPLQKIVRCNHNFHIHAIQVRARSPTCSNIRWNALPNRLKNTTAPSRDPRDGQLDVFTENYYVLRIGWYPVKESSPTILKGPVLGATQ